MCPCREQREKIKKIYGLGWTVDILDYVVPLPRQNEDNLLVAFVKGLYAKIFY